ncbi:hypothetical protein [Pedobacter duraquae]|uniref:Uncharacterized protein n=1 Tax=Pedobacter duraquae TaxID=425511 RepID=A0A4R6IPH6_9SPHI|nr:hypothetical protein [Pedobacter duraquae]TDO24192.1 hypothetical protein CLV32_0480 [Pedobacter duraquae]
MKQFYLIALLITIFWFSAVSQEKMIVHEEDWTAYTYQDASKTVLSFNKLPSSIQKEVKILMDESFWGLKDSIHFVNAQIVDVISYLKDGDPHKRHSVVPKYELNFYLKDTSVGINRYNITLHLDDYGQILKLNWPRHGAGSTKMFLSRKAIQEFAFKEANTRHYNLNNFFVTFEYKETFDRLCWEFSFLVKELVGAAEYNFIVVPWDELTLINSTK